MREQILYGLLALGVTTASATSLWNGAQTSQLYANISTACDAALNTTLKCPNAVQWLISGVQFVQWNTTGLQSLCTAGCQTSLKTLLSNVQSGCGSESYPFNGDTMTWVEQVEYVQYKYGLVCMQDTSTKNYCLDVEAGWNITTMAAQGKATWPKNTTKCYPNVQEDYPYYIKDFNGTCYSDGLFNNDQFINASYPPYSGQMQSLDYYYERSGMIADDNYGWPVALEYDEYPTEIQCSSCWINKFIYGYNNTWGDLWDEITSQIWANMQANCGISQHISPANNYSIWDSWNYQNSLDPPTTNLSMCIQTLTSTSNTTCQQLGLQEGVPVAGLSNLNYGINCQYLEGQTLCAPASCPIAVNTGPTQSLGPFLSQYTNFTQIQFLTWNPFVNTRLIKTGDTVCVGPPGGAYVPAGVATQASPSVYTTTATPAYPTPSGAISNCGLWYEVQSGDYCDLIALNFSLTFAQLVDMNPSLDANCTNLWVGYDYCVAPVNGTTVTPVTPSAAPSTTGTDSGQATAPPSSVTSTKPKTTTSPQKSTASTASKPTITTKTTTAKTSTVTTPTPTQTGMASGCTKFYEAVSGDTCDKIASAYSITTAQFESWNPAVGSSCGSLFVGYYYCVAK